MEEDLGRIRLYAMRIVFLLTFLGLGPATWSYIVSFNGKWNPLEGVAMAFWAALSFLAVLGVLYPLKMMPLLFLQLLYKLVWLTGVGWPLYSQGEMDEYTKDLFIANTVGVTLDLIVIPWIYVVKRYFGKIVW